MAEAGDDETMKNLSISSSVLVSIGLAFFAPGILFYKSTIPLIGQFLTSQMAVMIGAVFISIGSVLIPFMQIYSGRAELFASGVIQLLSILFIGVGYVVINRS